MQKGFTLLELLIVMAILGIVTTTVVLVINPAEYLRQSRDSIRMSDITTLSNALNHYQLTGAAMGTEYTDYISLPDSSSSCSNLGLPVLQPGWTYACSTSDNFRKNNGTGWVPLDFSLIPGGSVINPLPADPSNNASSSLWYNYAVVNSKYIVWAQNLESTKFASKAADDGGTSTTAYEAGQDLTITPRGAISSSGSLTQTTDTDFNAGTASAAIVSGSGASGNVSLNTYQYQVLNTSNLISYWKIDNDWNDSISTNNGNSSGTTFVAPKFGNYSGNIGYNQYVNIPDNANLNFGTSTNFSIEAWIRRNAADATQCFIFDKRSGASTGYVFYFYPSTQNLSMVFNGIVASSNLILSDLTSWHHVAATVNRSGNIIFYLDGIASTPTATPANNITTTNQATIGSRSFNQPSSSLRGNIDELAIYNRVLTSTEVSNHYNATSTGSFTSSVMDIGSNATPSTLAYTASTNASTTLTMDVRAGDVSTPDGTWTSWLTGVANGGSISSLGTKRYVQYKANMSTTDSSQAPVLNDVTVNYNYLH